LGTLPESAPASTPLPDSPAPPAAPALPVLPAGAPEPAAPVLDEPPKPAAPPGPPAGGEHAPPQTSTSRAATVVATAFTVMPCSSDVEAALVEATRKKVTI
jgi:hypothetical protein